MPKWLPRSEELSIGLAVGVSSDVQIGYVVGDTEPHGKKPTGAQVALSGVRRIYMSDESGATSDHHSA